MKDLIQEVERKLELHFLPPYAPDLKPDECVWGYMKTNGLSKKPLRKNESLKERECRATWTLSKLTGR